MAYRNLNLAATLKLQTDSFNKGLATAMRSLEGFRRSFLQVAGALGASLGIGGILANIKETATQLSVAKATLENVSGGLQGYGENMEWLKGIAKTYKQEIITLTDGFARFHAAAEGTNISLEEQKKIYEGLTRAATYFHMSADRTHNMMIAVEQMMSKGKITAEELRRQLGNNLPGAYAKMAQAAMEFGQTAEGAAYKNIKSFADFESAMKKGQVGLDVLLKFVEKLNEETANLNLDSLQLAMNDMKNAWAELVDSTGAENVLKKIYTAATNLFNFLNRNMTLVRDLINVLIISTIPKLIGAIGRIVAALKGLQWSTWVGAIISVFGTAIAYADNLDSRINDINRRLKQLSKINDKTVRLGELQELRAQKQAEKTRLDNDPKFQKEYKAWKETRGKRFANEKEYESDFWRVMNTKWGQNKDDIRFQNYEKLGPGLDKISRQIGEIQQELDPDGIIGPVYDPNKKGGTTTVVNPSLTPTDSGKGSKGTAPKTVRDYVQEYADDLEKLNNQANAGSKTTEEVISESYKLATAAWENITAFKNFREELAVLPDSLKTSAKSAEYMSEAARQLEEIKNGDADWENAQKWAKYRKDEAREDSEFKARETRFDFEKKDFEILRAEQEQWEELVSRLEAKMKEVENTFDEMDEKAIEEIQRLSEAMEDAKVHARNLKDAADVTEWQNKIKDLQKEYNEGLVNGITGVANSLDRVTDGFKKLNDAFEDEDTSNWEKMITLLNEIVQIFETMNSLVNTFNTLNEISQKLSKAKNAEEIKGLGEQVAGLGAVNIAKGTEIALSKTATVAAGQEAGASVANTAAKSGEAIAGATASGSKLPFPYNLVAIAAGVAAVIGALAMIGKYANGGIVGGHSYHGDHMLARLNSGEMILNAGQQGKLWNAINRGNFGTLGNSGGKVEFEIRGDKLVGAINNYNSKRRG